MSVHEIETAITQLPPDDLQALREWFDEFQAQAWDKQIERDARVGRFDALIQAAKNQVAAGQYHPLTPDASLVP